MDDRHDPTGRAHPTDQLPAGRQVERALAAAWLGGVRPTAITVELTADGRPASLIIDAPWGTTAQATRPVFEALGIRDPALVEWPEPGGRIRVDVDDGDPVRNAFGRLGIPVSLTVDGPTTQAGTGNQSAGDQTNAEVVDLASYRASHPTAVAQDDHEGWEL